MTKILELQLDKRKPAQDDCEILKMNGPVKNPISLKRDGVKRIEPLDRTLLFFIFIIEPIWLKKPTTTLQVFRLKMVLINLLRRYT